LKKLCSKIHLNNINIFKYFYTMYSIGIDIGGTSTKIGLVDSDGKILIQDIIDTSTYVEINDFVDAIEKTLRPWMEERTHLACKGIGIGAPNGNFYTGSIEFAPNLPWKGIVPLAKLFETKFKLPVIITNDANAAAIGEMRYGAAKGMNNFIIITLGTGVGSGFVVNGGIVYGHDGAAGELGHVIVIPDGRLCGCGRKGCLETYTSATGIVITASEIIQKHPNSILHSVESISSKEIYEAAKKNDAAAIEIFEVTGKILGECLANTIAITSPESIILFGGLARAEKYIFEPTERYMNASVLRIWKNKIKLLPSKLPENDVAILGAAALVV
jgi:glucokinase